MRYRPELDPISRRGFLAAGAGAGAGLLLAACGGGSTKPTSTGAAPPSGGKPVRGGRMRVAFVGGGQAEILNPSVASLADIDIARSYLLFDGLVSKIKQDGTVDMQLAESIEPNADGTVWTIKLRPDVEWHDGSPFGADDVVYWLRYLAQPKHGADNNFMCELFFDVKNAKKLDKLTVRLPMKLPIADLPSLLAFASYGVIKNGTTSFSHPIGTGPFKFVSWKPGQNSVFARNPNYWQSDLPYLDTLELVSIPDDAARVNALLSGQVDAAASIPYAQAKAYMSQGSGSPINILVNSGVSQTYFTMGMSRKPFDDQRVREAFKLIVDRHAMLNQVNSGLGEVLNDLWGKGLRYYHSDIEQREPDIEQAKSLLKQAGYENLTTTITTSTEKIGQAEAATLLAQQAKAAGVTINVRKVPPETYYSTGWPNYPFGQTSYESATIPYFYSAALLPGAPFNDTQWHDAGVVKLLRDALSDLKPETAQDKWNAFQQKMWSDGGLIAWGTSPWIDGLAKNVRGAMPLHSTFASFGGYDFMRYWLA